MTERQFIEKLSALYAERRSDVSEICDAFLKTGKFKKSWAEDRFIQATIPKKGITVEYDTLTTELSFMTKKKDWAPLTDHQYSH